MAVATIKQRGEEKYLNEIIGMYSDQPVAETRLGEAELLRAT